MIIFIFKADIEKWRNKERLRQKMREKMRQQKEETREGPEIETAKEQNDKTRYQKYCPICALNVHIKLGRPSLFTLFL